MAMLKKVMVLAMHLALCTPQLEERPPVEDLLIHAMKRQILACPLMLLIPSIYLPGILSVLRRKAIDGLVVMSSYSEEWVFRSSFLAMASKCSALVFQLHDTNTSTIIKNLSHLDRMGIWKHPEARVLVVGCTKEFRSVLLHPCLRNTINGNYLALPDHPAVYTQQPILHLNDQRMISEVTLYRRCLYCEKGEKGIAFVGHWNLSSGFHRDNLLPEKGEELWDLKSHSLKIVAVPYFPYMDFERNKEESGTVVTPKYSIDTYLISTLANHLNFTYVVHEEPQQTWGLEKDGIFTGMMGVLQREEADFCTIAGPSPGRLKVIGFLRGYPSDLMTVVSLKPSVLPQHLSIILPFSGFVWASICMCLCAMGVVLWTVQLGLKSFGGTQDVDLNTALLYSWGSLLEQSLKSRLKNTSLQIVVCAWLLFCLTISSAFKSSLIAHLTIPGMSRPPDTLEDLVNSKVWRWATEPWLLKGVPFEYFSKHPHPVVKKIHQGMEVLPADEGLEEVLKGDFSLIDFENYITIIISSHYSDKHGRTPFMISKKGFSIMAAFGWGFRKGAPFYGRFQQLINRLEDTGIISYWTDEVIKRRIRENRETAKIFIHHSATEYTENHLMRIALGLEHLKGAFYLLFIGYGVAFLSIIMEIVFAQKQKQNKQV